MEALVEFGTGAWLLILAYDLALLAAFALPCDDDLPFPWLRVFFLAPGVVVDLRLSAPDARQTGPVCRQALESTRTRHHSLAVMPRTVLADPVCSEHAARHRLPSPTLLRPAG